MTDTDPWRRHADLFSAVTDKLNTLNARKGDGMSSSDLEMVNAKLHMMLEDDTDTILNLRLFRHDGTIQAHLDYSGTIHETKAALEMLQQAPNRVLADIRRKYPNIGIRPDGTIVHLYGKVEQ